MIQLHRLEGFYWVARTGGYAKAARAFPYPITQPAVHQQVKKLESDLGTTLFERVGKETMLPTQAGRRLFEFVQPFFERLPGVLRALQKGEFGGELRIQTAGLLLRHLMPAWVKRIRKARPDVRVHIEEHPAAGVERLRRGEIDLVVDYVPKLADDIASMHVATVRPFLVAPRAHPAAGKKKLPFAALAEETFISYPPGTLHHDLQMQALAANGVVPQHTVSASSADVILGFVEAGLGYSLVPSLEEKGPSARGLAVAPIESPKIEFAIHACWRKDTPENPVLDTALELAPEP